MANFAFPNSFLQADAIDGWLALSAAGEG